MGPFLKRKILEKLWRRVKMFGFSGNLKSKIKNVIIKKKLKKELWIAIQNADADRYNEVIQSFATDMGINAEKLRRVKNCTFGAKINKDDLSQRDKKELKIWNKGIRDFTVKCLFEARYNYK